MPLLRPRYLSDPLSPEARLLWDEVRRWLASHGWREGSGGWALTIDPTGGRQSSGRVPGVLSSEPPADPFRAARRAWWSMSDNCLVLNRLVDRGLCRVFHGHPLTLAGRDAEAQRSRFALWSAALIRGDSFPEAALPPVTVLREPWPATAEVIGGNLTALETLAEAGQLPRADGRVLLVESLSARPEEALRRLRALVGRPEFASLAGVAVGRFTLADRDAPGWLGPWNPEGPAARWPQVGHGADGWTVPLGEPLRFSRSSTG